MHRLQGEIPMVFMPDYGLALAQRLVSGADI
jgi:glucan phosphorylase